MFSILAGSHAYKIKSPTDTQEDNLHQDGTKNDFSVSLTPEVVEGMKYDYMVDRSFNFKTHQNHKKSLKSTIKSLLFN